MGEKDFTQSSVLEPQSYVLEVIEMGGKVERFEDLIAWQKARQLTVEIYRITAQGEFARDFGLRDQIRRAAVSVMSNIAEGFDRGSRGEFHQFLVVAKASCAEVRSQLYVALDVGYIVQEIFREALNKSFDKLRTNGNFLIPFVASQRFSHPWV